MQQPIPENAVPPELPPQTAPAEPNTQAKPEFRKNWPVWMRFLPQRVFQPAEPQIDAPLIDPVELQKILAGTDEATQQKIKDDIKFLEYEVLRLFRERDHAAKKQQNSYRLYQILFLGLAAVATTLGSFQALSLAANNRVALAIWAFLETVVALVSVFLATISGREPPLPLWLTNRRRAEQLRREYFRFLMNLQPYTELDDIKRRLLLSERAAEINRGVFPDESGVV